MSNQLWIVMLFVLQWTWFFSERSRVNMRFRALRARYTLLARRLGVEAEDPLVPSEAVKALAFAPGKEIAAIKLYRDETGADLQEAADVIHRLQRTVSKVMP